MKEMNEEQWDNHARNLQAKMVEFSSKNHLAVSWIEEWLSTFTEAGNKLRHLRDLANILLEYQSENGISTSDMTSLIDWLSEEAMLFNIEDTQKKEQVKIANCLPYCVISNH
jgi:hypothetical protein